MKTSYEISVSFFISVGLFIISIFLICRNGSHLYNYNHLKDLAYMEEASLEDGKYVTCTIDSYLIKHIDILGQDGYRGVGGGYSFGIGSACYYEYNIPMSDGKYIRVLIKDEDIIEKLENFARGQGEPVTVIGIVQDSWIIDDGENTYSDYEGAEGFNLDMLCKEYVIKEKSDMGLQVGLATGITIFLFSIYLYWTKGRIERKAVEIKEKNYDVIYAYSYNKVMELSVEEEQLRFCEKKLVKVKKKALIGAGCIICGIGLFLIAFRADVLSYSSIFLILFGIKKIWNYFINSHMGLAVKMAHVFRIDTIPKEIELSKQKIAAIKRQMDMDVMTDEKNN